MGCNRSCIKSIEIAELTSKIHKIYETHYEGTVPYSCLLSSSSFLLLKSSIEHADGGRDTADLLALRPFTFIKSKLFLCNFTYGEGGRDKERER